jgi:hypothetical protein
MSQPNTSLFVPDDLKLELQQLALNNQISLSAITRALYEALLSGKITLKQLGLKK